MNLIKYLQSGGYILPNYSQGSVSYQAPETAFGMMDRLFQHSNQDMSNYIQLENLNQSRMQTTQSYFNSMIQNKIAIDREQRVNKQMDITNKRLELDMLKESDSILDEMMKYDQDNYLERDRAALDKIYKEHGVDTESLMKNPHNLEQLIKAKTLRKQLGMAHKTAWSNRMAVKDASDIIAQTEQYDKILADYEKRGIPLNVDEVLAYTEARRVALNELVGFKQGTVAALDLNADHWKTIMSLPDYVDRVAQQEQMMLDKQTQQIENQAKLAQAEANQARATVDNAKAQVELATLPYEIQDKIIKGGAAALKQAETFIAISEILPGIDMKTPTALYDAISKASPAQLDKLSKAFEKLDDTSKETTYTSLQAAIATGIARDWPQEKIDKLMSALKIAQTSNSNMNYSGIPAKADGSLGRGTNDKPVNSKNGDLTDYGTWQVNNKTGEVAYITVGGMSFNMTDWKASAGVNAGIEKWDTGKSGATLKIDYSTDMGKQFIKQVIGSKKPKETEEQWAERFVRTLLTRRNHPKSRMDSTVKNSLGLKGIIRISADTTSSNSTGASGYEAQGW